MREMHTYSIVLEPDTQSGFTVTVPALPGCVTEGETVDQCVVNAREAIELYLEDLLATGGEPPDEKAAPQVLRVTVAA